MSERHGSLAWPLLTLTVFTGLAHAQGLPGRPVRQGAGAEVTAERVTLEPAALLGGRWRVSTEGRDQPAEMSFTPAGENRFLVVRKDGKLEREGLAAIRQTEVGTLVSVRFTEPVEAEYSVTERVADLIEGGQERRPSPTGQPSRAEYYFNFEVSPPQLKGWVLIDGQRRDERAVPGTRGTSADLRALDLGGVFVLERSEKGFFRHTVTQTMALIPLGRGGRDYYVVSVVRRDGELMFQQERSNDQRVTRGLARSEGGVLNVRFFSRNHGGAVGTIHRDVRYVVLPGGEVETTGFRLFSGDQPVYRPARDQEQGKQITLKGRRRETLPADVRADQRLFSRRGALAGSWELQRRRMLGMGNEVTQFLDLLPRDDGTFVAVSFMWRDDEYLWQPEYSEHGPHPVLRVGVGQAASGHMRVRFPVGDHGARILLSDDEAIYSLVGEQDLETESFGLARGDQGESKSVKLRGKRSRDLGQLIRSLR